MLPALTLIGAYVTFCRYLKARHHVLLAGGASHLRVASVIMGFVPRPTHLIVSHVLQVIREAVQAVEQDGIVFIDEIDKIVSGSEQRFGAPQGLMRHQGICAQMCSAP